MAIRESAFKSLERIAEVKSMDERIERARDLCRTHNVFALIFQYTYHPDVVFDLPEGDIPTSLYTPATHDEYANFHQNVKKLKNFFTNSPVKRWKKEENFTVLCETICAVDVPLLIGIKDKKLPWRTLNKSFAYKAFPELFPASVVAEEAEV